MGAVPASSIGILRGESRVQKNKKIHIVMMAVAVLFEGGALVDARPSRRKSTETYQKHRTLALSEDEVKQLILMMDTDKNGKISKQEFLAFMSAEFDRLDKDKSGELDVKELAQSQLRPSRAAAVGK